MIFSPHASTSDQEHSTPARRASEGESGNLVTCPRLRVGLAWNATSPIASIACSFTISAVLFFLPTSGWSEAKSHSSLSHEELVQQAERSFFLGLEHKHNPDLARKHFSEAAKLFHDLEERGVRTVALYRNLARSEYLADRLPHAILAWRKGLQLAPGDPDMRTNLEYARKQVAWPPDGAIYPPPILWPVGVPFPSMNQIALVLVGFFAMMCLALVRWIMIWRVKWLLLSLLSFFICLVLGAGLAAFQIIEVNNETFPIVVIAREKTPFLRGNGYSYPANEKVPVLARGMEGRLLFERGDWLQIEFSGGQIGWVPKSAVLIDSR